MLMPETDAARRYAVILPACNEEPCLARVLTELRAVLWPAEQFVLAVGVNGSTDRSAEIARECGAVVAVTAARGYGHGCQAVPHCLCLVESAELQAGRRIGWKGRIRRQQIIQCIDVAPRLVRWQGGDCLCHL